MTADEILDRETWPEWLATNLPRPSDETLNTIGAAHVRLISPALALVRLNVLTTKDAKASTTTAVSRLLEEVIHAIRWELRDPCEPTIASKIAMGDPATEGVLQALP